MGFGQTNAIIDEEVSMDWDSEKRALLLGEWVNEARETAFLEDRSVNALFYGA